jgi:hypothetical protein
MKCGMAGGHHSKIQKKKAGQMVLRFDGEVAWARFGHHT